MTDQDLEQRLRDHYRALDPTVAPRDLGHRIEDAMERREIRPAFLGRLPAMAAGLAAVLLVAAVIALRPGGFLSTTGGEPTATPSATAGSSPSASPAPSATAVQPSGSVPPISSVPWASLDLRALPNGPTAGTVVVQWSGGYVALGDAALPATTVPAWISRDGRSWIALPEGTFGNAIGALGAPAGGGVVILAVAQNGATTWRSLDGMTWVSSPSPQLPIHGYVIAGGSNGVVVSLERAATPLEFSPDGVTWQAVSLPGPATAMVQGVAAFGTGFVAVGDSGTATGSPLAWWSNDGLTWSAATIQAHLDGGFSSVYAGADGLVAISSTATTPGLASFWTSSDGRTWSLGTDPLGTWQQGEGAGSANGLFAGDGVRLLGYGIRADNQPTQYWTSLDGTSWTQLTLTGDTTAATTGQVTPSLLRDGILFGGEQGSWLGTAIAP